MQPDPNLYWNMLVTQKTLSTTLEQKVIQYLGEYRISFSAAENTGDLHYYIAVECCDRVN